MIHAYYRSSWWRQPFGYYDMLENFENDPNFLPGLTPDNLLYGKQLFTQMVRSCLTDKSEREKASNPREYFENNKNIEILIKDADGKEVKCLLVFGNVDGWREYYNATHDFYAYVTALQAIQIKKENEETYHLNQELTDRFEGLVYSAGASIGDGDEVFSVEKMSPEVFDLFAIREGISPKAKREQIIAEREEAKRIKEEAEKEKVHAIEEDYYEKKYGIVTSRRSYEKKLHQNDLDEK